MSDERVSPIQEAFVSFHAANPHVYERLVEMSRRLLRRGHQKIGIGMLFEVLRWEHLIQTTGDADNFKLNNNYRALYARMVMARNPDLDGIFELRRLHWEDGAEPFGQQTAAWPVGHVAPPRFEESGQGKLL